MTQIVAKQQFQTARQLISALEQLIVGVDLDEVYVKTEEGDLTSIAVEQETLSDGSVCFNVILLQEADPNS